MSADPETPAPGGQFLVYQTEDGRLKIDVRFEGEFRGALVDPGDGERQQLIQRRHRAIFQMPMEGSGERRGLGLLQQSEPGEGAGETGGDGDRIVAGE